MKEMELSKHSTGKAHNCNNETKPLVDYVIFFDGGFGF